MKATIHYVADKTVLVGALAAVNPSMPEPYRAAAIGITAGATVIAHYVRSSKDDRRNTA